MKHRGPIVHAFARQLGREVRTFCGLLGKRGVFGGLDDGGEQIVKPFSIQLRGGGLSTVVGIADKSQITCEHCRKAMK